ncbi:hypothetical protein [Lunatimonas lonarensis]|uniref:hypothetical protein n=1 Tax=Lunatimonas lonarensis TaxID=1232681 RepID=UPI0012DCA0B2|nr:hypothetical protein [Lunatimonas lonarensis]
MKQSETYRLWRERAAIALVVFFCALVSSADYVMQHTVADTKSLQHSLDETEDSGSTEKDVTFIHTVVDAVVPFVMVAVEHVLHFIYDISLPQQPQSFYSSPFFQLSSGFFEVLFEHIVSANAP